MVILKFLIGILKLPIFQDTLLKGFNYSLGFVGIHIWHGVVATKQPAMTASTIAQSIESTTSHEEIKELGNVIIKVFRSQFAAVMGNLLMVFPVTFIITFAYYRFTGSPLMPVEEAHHKFELVNPIHSLAILHAAIAGVMLFLSGILSGLADNGNMFNKYAERLQHGGLIQKLIGIRKTKIFSRYISHNLGSLTGNFSLGFLLAIVAFIGFITGTPLDIQHVTFATGNLGFATASIYDHITIREAFWAIAGIAAIGLTNIGVSFSLTMVVAIKSRGIDLALTPAIVRYVLRKFFKAPLDFFLPRY
jgi:site-specific recombinase